MFLWNVAANLLIMKIFIVCVNRVHCRLAFASCILRGTPWPAPYKMAIIVWGLSAGKLEKRERGDYKNVKNLWDWSTDSAPLPTFPQKANNYLRRNHTTQGLEVIANNLAQAWRNAVIKLNAQPALSEQHLCTTSVHNKTAASSWNSIWRCCCWMVGDVRGLCMAELVSATEV